MSKIAVLLHISAAVIQLKARGRGVHRLTDSYSDSLHGSKAVTSDETNIAHACKVGGEYVRRLEKAWRKMRDVRQGGHAAGPTMFSFLSQTCSIWVAYAVSPPSSGTVMHFTASEMGPGVSMPACYSILSAQKPLHNSRCAKSGFL